MPVKNLENGMDEFMQLLGRHRDEVYRYVQRTVWDRGAADDVFAASVLAAWENWHRFQRGTNFRAWLYRIATNKCFVANRVTRRTPEPLDGVPEGALADLGSDRGYQDVMADPDGFLEQCGDEVVVAFAKLSTAERSCLLLRSAERFSYKEIAEILEIPVGTVMTHLSRGRAKLRGELLDYARSRGFVRTMPRLLSRGDDETRDAAAQGSA
jgi:RNA polymerase sigma-70 factor (ECF subfamily)